MKKITFESNYGHFAYRFTAEVGEEVNQQSEWLCLQGLANIAYRVAGSAVDKALGIKERKSVEYSDADGERINAAVSKKLTELAGKEGNIKLLNMSFAVTRQHVFGESSDAAPTKEATAIWTKIQSLPEADFAEKLKFLKLGDDYTDEQAIMAVMTGLRAARAAAKAKADAETMKLMGV